MMRVSIWSWCKSGRVRDVASRRSDLFERRRHLMNEWTAYLNGGRGTGDSPPR